MKKIVIVFFALLLISSNLYAATRRIVPRADGEGGIGATDKNWGSSFFDDIWTDSIMHASDIIVTNTASSPVIHATTSLDVGSIFIGKISMDGSNNMLFMDGITGQKTLAELAAGATGNPFNQILNTTSSPTLANLTITYNLTATDNVTANFFKGNGSQLTGIVTGALAINNTTNEFAQSKLRFLVGTNVSSIVLANDSNGYVNITINTNDVSGNTTGLTAEVDTLYSVVARQGIAGANISASNVIVDNTASAVVIDTQFLEYSSGGSVTIRDPLTINGIISGDATGLYNINLSNGTGVVPTTGISDLSRGINLNGSNISLYSISDFQIKNNTINTTQLVNQTIQGHDIANNTINYTQLDNATKLAINNTTNEFWQPKIRFLVGANVNSIVLANDSNGYINVTINTIDTTGNGTSVLTESDTLYSVVTRQNIAGKAIYASDIIVDTTASAPVIDTQYIEYSSGGPVTFRDIISGSGAGIFSINGANVSAMNISQTTAFPSSEFALRISDEQGTGSVVMNTSPKIESPTFIGTPLFPNNVVNSSIIKDYEIIATDLANTTRFSVNNTTVEFWQSKIRFLVGSNVSSVVLANDTTGYVNITINTKDTGIAAESDTLYSVVTRQGIAGGDISASDVIVTNTASSVVVDTQYIDYSSGTPLTFRTPIGAATFTGTVTVNNTGDSIQNTNLTVVGRLMLNQSGTSTPGVNNTTLPLFLNVTGTNTTFMGLPATWVNISVNGTFYKMPCYL